MRDRQLHDKHDAKQGAHRGAYTDFSVRVLDLAKLYLSTGEKRKLGDLIGKLEEQRDVIEHQYRCSKCGFEFKTKKWFCPSCKAVDSFVM